jgi:hypothetical protein
MFCCSITKDQVCILFVKESARVHPGTTFMAVILRSKATKNLIVTGAAEILRGACPEPVEGLRMTWRSFRMNTNY